MHSQQKREKESVDLFKKISTLEEKKRLSSPLREKLAFLHPDIFYRTLQRVCSVVLNFHEFHLLRQIDAGPLYPLIEILLVSCSVLSSTVSSNLYTRGKVQLIYFRLQYIFHPPKDNFVLSPRPCIY
jgi:hypothetical protein